MNGYLTKPIDLQMLNKVLNRELEVVAEAAANNDLSFVGEHINLTDLKQLVNDNKEKIFKYVKISVESVPQDLDDMQSYLDHEDWEMVGRTAHKMKSNAGYMGMNKVMPILQELEQLKSTMGNYDEIGPKVDELEKESLLALEELKHVLNTLGS